MQIYANELGRTSLRKGEERAPEMCHPWKLGNDWAAAAVVVAPMDTTLWNTLCAELNPKRLSVSGNFKQVGANFVLFLCETPENDWNLIWFCWKFSIGVLWLYSGVLEEIFKERMDEKISSSLVRWLDS